MRTGIGSIEWVPAGVQVEKMMAETGAGSQWMWEKRMAFTER